MFFNYITIFIALAISGVAIFYSVAGLATIFAASVVPVIIMGGVLEVGKLVTAVWLHRNWKTAVWWLKTYLVVSVVILMLITSMGIFGYLSKSHIEQSSASDEQVAQIDILTENIVRLDTKIKRWDDEIKRLSSGDINNTRVDNLIKREEDALAKINQTIDKEKKEYRRQTTSDISAINSKLEQYRIATRDEISSINEQLKTCFACDDERQALNDAKSNLANKESKADNDIARIKEQLTTNLNNIVNRYSSQLNPINERITELKTQSSNKTQDIDKRILVLEQNIETTQTELASNRADKSVLETKFRQLEAEVGPVKYIAEFVYSQKADRTMLEEAVRWVIVTIIFVFDPLAVLLLIASQYSFEEYRRKHKKPTPPTNTPPSRPKGHIPLKYEDVIGKSFRGKYHPVDRTVESTEYNKRKKKPIKKVVTGDKISNKPKKKVVKKKVSKSNISNKDVDAITALIAGNSEEYITYGNKKHRKQALELMHPELLTNVSDPVEFGINFPDDAHNATLFLRTDFLPTKLFRFNEESWVELEKDLLKRTAYSEEYITYLINKINEHDYDKVLLDAVVAENTSNEDDLIFNQVELDMIINFDANQTENN